MEPEDINSFFITGEDYSQFTSTYRFYTFDSFFQDSKLNRVGKSGDCGSGTTGGSGDIQYNAPGTTLTNSYNGHIITTTFSNTTVSTPYNYNSTIVSNGTVNTVSTVATSGVVQVVTNGPSAPIYTETVSAGTAQISSSYSPQGSGGTACTNTTTMHPDGGFTIKLCAVPDNNQNKSTLTAYGSDCTNGSGTFALNTAAKPVYKLSAALQGLLTFGQFEWFTDAQHTERLSLASELVWFLLDNGINDENIEFVLMAIDAVMDGGTVDVDEQIIDNLSGKAKCIYEKLKGLSGNLFSSIINDTFDGSKESHVLFEVGEIPDENNFEYNAKTYPSYNGNGSQRFYRIRLKTSFVENASNIEIALAIIHESIHAELLERSIQSGLLLNIGTNGSYTFQNYGNPSSLNNITIFNALSTYYKNYGGSNPQWNHDQFNIFGYREAMRQNLEDSHPWLDNQQNPFQNIINSDPVINNLSDFLDNISWGGLESTQEYINLSSAQKTKIQYVFQKVRSTYNKTCSN